mmetsp:Transcript_21273/g.50069  ORF Transcript_21273/g.50069 Transcript_21273/m.50069 type:complete len:91 (+) Transcript_21273:344-616(+)
MRRHAGASPEAVSADAVWQRCSQVYPTVLLHLLNVNSSACCEQGARARSVRRWWAFVDGFCRVTACINGASAEEALTAAVELSLIAEYNW